MQRIVLRTLPKFRGLVKSASPAAQLTVRSMTGLLEKKEQSEEARYIHKKEFERQAQLKAELDRILALEDHHEEKQELHDLIEKKKEAETSLIAKYGLNDWKFALPVTLLLAIPTISNEVLVIDAETQLTACFLLFCSTMYTQVGPMVSKSLDDSINEIKNEMDAVDETIQQQIHSAMDINKKSLGVEEDYKEFYTLTDQVAVAQADVLNHAERHHLREAIAKKLDALQTLENTVASAVRARMLSTVKSNVIDTFKNDKAAKEAALNQAIAVLSSGVNGKRGKDIVGDAFHKSLNKYKEDYAKKPAGSDEILIQLEKDMAAIAAAPVPASKGGNVFEMLAV